MRNRQREKSFTQYSRDETEEKDVKNIHNERLKSRFRYDKK